MSFRLYHVVYLFLKELSIQFDFGALSCYIVAMLNDLVKRANEMIRDQIFTDLLDCGLTTKEAHEWASSDLDVKGFLKEAALTRVMDPKEYYLIPTSGPFSPN